MLILFAEKEVDENEEPQDLSLKCRQRVIDSKCCDTKDPNPPFHFINKSTPLSRKFNLPPLSSLNSPYRMEADIPCTGNEGLNLIAEVSSKFGEFRPSAFEGPIRVTSNLLHKRVSHSSCSTPSPIRITQKKETSAYYHHPYFSFGIYGLPQTYSFPKVQNDTENIPLEKQIMRGGSVSPSGNSSTETSGSEGSPELRVDKLTCRDCGRAYATVAGLARHHQFHCLKDTSRSFSCKHCEKTYTSTGALKMHVRTHTLPCKCHICGKAFSRPWLLQGHIRTHTGEKPFQCQQCLRSFADRSNLRAHLQTHEDIKKYGCKTCQKTFSRMSLLVKHQDHGCQGMTKSKHFPGSSLTINI